MISLRRPTISTLPAASTTRPRSPVRNQPSVGERLGVGRRVGVIAEMHAGAQRRDLADLAARHLVAGLVDDLQLHARDDAADGAVDLGRIVAEARVGVKAGLQHAVELDQVARHARLVVADGLDRGRGAAGDDDAQRGHVVAGEIRLVEHGDDRGRRRGDVGDALALDQLERRLRREALEQHGPAAAHDRLQQAQIAPVEADRQVDELHVLVGHAHVAR